ncbi:bifunctional [glutamate--ammonia ligase]-adenylyl-L-tyrosine phosphorylase/[glutamate--ammonia-ligase] adenylyltransferase [Spongorhabdus nitratireducens]
MTDASNTPAQPDIPHLPFDDQLPAVVRNKVADHWETFIERASDQELLSQLQSLSEERLAELVTVWGGSDYVAEQCQRIPEQLLELIDSKALDTADGLDIHRQNKQALLDGITDENSLMIRLRQFRQQQMVRIIWRDLTRKATTVQTTRDLSLMAELCIDAALDWLYEDMCKLFGTPWGESGQQRLVVLGMGKLGAYELNLSSDIDLMFTFAEQGETKGGRRSLSSQEFFVRLGQRLIKVLDQQTAYGFVFRVDMRLRPYGSSGALALSFGAMEQYYQDQGRDWERYAMIKARVVAGDRQAGSELLATLKPFVYRRYIDFGAIEALRDMKRLIQREVKRRGMQENVKLGAGGIREVEFIGQAFQLIHGGRDFNLQHRSILTVLATLGDKGYLEPETVKDLKAAYFFLRNAEHALQAVADAQTQTLPEAEDARTRLAWVMGYNSWEAFSEQLEQHRNKVRKQFDHVVADPDEENEAGSEREEWEDFWDQRLTDEEEVALLQRHGFDDPADIRDRLLKLRDSRVVSSLQREGRHRLRAFMPLLLQAVSNHEKVDTALQRLLPLVEAVLRRTAYLVLLQENPDALEHLIRLCVASPWIAEQIIRHPVLLDEFLNLGALYDPPRKHELRDELRQQLAHIQEDDLENLMEALRHFKMAHVLRVAAAQLAGSLPLMKESDYLTDIAEVILEAVVDIAWRDMTSRYGRPQREDGSLCDPGFAIIAYGKLGGIELGPGSDLDLVFLHDGAEMRPTDGERSIDSGVFFMRMGQRILHIMTTRTNSGQLYDVDMRLRPSGKSGLMVTSLKSFDNYQQNSAWTWEHQALVRARLVAGCLRVGEAFQKVRSRVLSKERDIAQLQLDVRTMRQKMRDHLGTRETAAGSKPSAWDATGIFDIKHDAGGIVDIEFMVQYAVLARAHNYPELLRFTDNIRITEQLQQADVLSEADASLLREAYKAFRQEIHRLALQNKKAKISGDRFHEYRQGVIRIWQEHLEPALKA